MSRCQIPDLIDELFFQSETCSRGYVYLLEIEITSSIMNVAFKSAVSEHSEIQSGLESRLENVRPILDKIGTILACNWKHTKDNFEDLGAALLRKALT